MRSLKKSSKNLPDLIIDTSTFFSALYNHHGNEAYLFTLADEGKCTISIADYVMDELEAVFKRKEMDFQLVLDLLDTYHNVSIEELERLQIDEIQLAVKMIADLKDRPIFIFAHRKIKRDENTYFVSGDKIFFQDDVRRILDRRVLTTREFIDMIG